MIKSQKIEYTSNQVEIKKNHPGRATLPEHLERREFIIERLEKTEGYNALNAFYFGDFYSLYIF